MKQKQKKSKVAIILSMIFVFLMITTLNVRNTGAYFSDYDQRSGQSAIRLSIETVLNEEVDSEGNKHITIQNTGESDVWVRLRVYANSEYITYEHDERWVQESDGFFYYREILGAGESAGLFHVNVRENIRDYNFEIIVIYEAERVTYDGETPIRGWGR